MEPITYVINEFVTDDASCPITKYEPSDLNSGITLLNCPEPDEKIGCRTLEVDGARLQK